MAIVAHCDYSFEFYQAHFAIWAARACPDRCRYCNGHRTLILWGTYARWVYTRTDRIRIQIERVYCVECHVTEAILPSFLHPFRRYELVLIQRVIMLIVVEGVRWCEVIDDIGPCNQPVPSTMREWVETFVFTAQAWLLAWLQERLLRLDPLLEIDLGQPPPHLLNMPNPQRRAAFIQGWQALCLMERLYASERARQPNLVFEAQALFAFVLASLGASGHRIPRLLWPQYAAQAP